MLGVVVVLLCWANVGVQVVLAAVELLLDSSVAITGCRGAPRLSARAAPFVRGVRILVRRLMPLAALLLLAGHLRATY